MKYFFHTGIYAITAHVLSQVNNEILASLMKESEKEGEFETDLSTELRLSSANFVVTKCLTGERLWVRCDSDNVKLTNNNRLSSFTGFIIQRL